MKICKIMTVQIHLCIKFVVEEENLVTKILKLIKNKQNSFLYARIYDLYSTARSQNF